MMRDKNIVPFPTPAIKARIKDQRENFINAINEDAGHDYIDDLSRDGACDDMDCSEATADDLKHDDSYTFVESCETSYGDFDVFTLPDKSGDVLMMDMGTYRLLLFVNS